MKKILILSATLFCASLTFAQKKAVKEAKSNIDKTAEARTLIKPALTDPETAADPETWFVAGNIEFNSFEKQYEAEMTKEVTKSSGWDQDVAFTGLYNMLDYYKKADELGEIPNEKGKVKNKVRKDILKNIKTGYPFLINAGVYYSEQANDANRAGNKAGAKDLNSKAADMFVAYWDVPSWSMFEKDPIEPTENTPIIKYYAVISSIQAEDHERAISYLKRLMDEPYVKNETYKESDLYELLADEYRKAEDNNGYLETLKIGSSKFPTNKFLTSNYINELLKAEKYDKAIEYLDQAVANDPSSICELMGVKGSLLTTKKDYEGAKSIYEDILKKDPNCGRAIYGIGFVEVVQAEALNALAGQETNRTKQKEYDEQIKSLYLNSVPYLEKYRTILEGQVKEGDTYKPDVDLSDYKDLMTVLNSVYYSLNFYKQPNMEQKFNETDKVLTGLKEIGY